MVRPIPGAAGGILSYFVRHRTAANLLLVLLLVAGAAAIPNMRAQFFPDVIVDNVRVTTLWEGAGAEDVESSEDGHVIYTADTPQQRQGVNGASYSHDSR